MTAAGINKTVRSYRIWRNQNIRQGFAPTPVMLWSIYE